MKRVKYWLLALCLGFSAQASDTPLAFEAIQGSWSELYTLLKAHEGRWHFYNCELGIFLSEDSNARVRAHVWARDRRWKQEMAYAFFFPMDIAKQALPTRAAQELIFSAAGYNTQSNQLVRLRVSKEFDGSLRSFDLMEMKTEPFVMKARVMCQSEF